MASARQQLMAGLSASLASGARSKPSSANCWMPSATAKASDSRQDQLVLFAAVWQARQTAAEQAEEPTDDADDDHDDDAASGAGGSAPQKRPGGRQASAAASQGRADRTRSGGVGEALPACQQDLRPIGEESSERYEYIPAQLTVIEDVCKKYACDCTVKTATKPPQPIEKSTAGASLLAQVIVAKCVDHCRCTGRKRFSSGMGWRSHARPWEGGWRSAAICCSRYMDARRRFCSNRR